MPAVLAVVALRRGLSGSQVFYLRDLSFYYWPVHLWFRRSVADGWPLWDPGPAFGQAAVADAPRQIFFPFALLARGIPSEAWGFNLLVAAPVVLAAVGVARLLRRSLSPLAAAFAGCAFALGGPVLSSANSLNLSWSIAAVPWLLAAGERLTERPSASRVTALAAIVALQWLAGEPVTAAASIPLTALVSLAGRGGSSRRPSRLGWLAFGLGAGLALAAVQLLPLLAAVARSGRGQAGVPDLLSIHPALLLETVAPRLFGDPFGPWTVADPWLGALSDGHPPFFLSMYLGVPLLALAAVGMADPSRERGIWIWAGIAAVSVLLALGRHAPLLPALQELLPALRSFRYPAKHLLFGALALSVLAGRGLLLVQRASGRPGVPGALAVGVAVAAAFGLAALLAFAAPDTASSLVSGWCGRPDLAAALAEPLRDGAARCAALAAGTVLALGLAARVGRGPAAARLVFALAAVDLLAANDPLNPTLPAAALGEPGWLDVVRERPAERTYVGGRVSWATGRPDADDVPRDPGMAPRATSRAAVGALYGAAFATFPGAWGVREAISVDLTQVWPREYAVFLDRFAATDPAGRTRVLQRVGVRYFLTPRAPAPDARVRAMLPRFPPLALFEVEAPAARAQIVPAALVQRDRGAAIAALFEPAFDPARVVLLEDEPPPAAGTPGPGQAPGATIERESAGEVVVRATAGEGGGWLVLLDGFDPDWRAVVDGEPAPVVRADGLFRVVRLASGSHEVRMRFEPRALRAGTIVAFAGLALLALVGLTARKAGTITASPSPRTHEEVP